MILNSLARAYTGGTTERGNTAVTLYVGNSGAHKTNGVTAPSTLKRGILEAQRSCLSSNKGLSLDTDFIVGSAIRYFINKGLDCCWEHIRGSNPQDEKKFCKEYKPILQVEDGALIKNEFRHPRDPGNPWKNSERPKAEASLFRKFADLFS